MKIIDCSYPINNESPVYPGDPRVDIKETASFKEDGYRLTYLSLTQHVATHVDAPSHLSKSMTQASDFPVELMVSDACVVDVSSQSTIQFTENQIKQIKQFHVVFLYTGWSKYYGSEYYLEHPALSKEAAKLLIEANVKVLVLDMPSLDYAPFTIHQTLFEAGIWIVENVMMNEEVLALGVFKSIITPIKIEAEAALARVLVMEKNS
jgi:kynurenine formamidase